MFSRRAQLTRLTIALAGAVFALDFLWSLAAGSTGSLAYGLVAEPAHLATCAVVLVAVTAFAGISPSRRFTATALLASVAIDIDHVPGYLGSNLLAGNLPRPYPHSALLVLSLLALGFAARREARDALFGIAFGVSSHLLRDLATGPGVPLFWPISGVVVRLPYAVFAGALLLAVLTVWAAAGRSVSVRARFGLPALLAAGLLATTLIGVALAGAPSLAAAPIVRVGAYIPGAASNPALIEVFGQEIGRSPATIITYKNWSQAPFVRSELEAISGQGAIPMVTWEPWSSSGQGVSLRRIAAGDYDGYLSDAARAAVVWGRPLMVRFAQEMNGSWFPWSGDPRAYQAAWRHVVGVFRRAGADQVRWVWTPYVNSGGLSFRRYFPGNRWVDWVGLDGFNWGGAFPWRSFAQLFVPSYRQLVGISSRPVVLAEIGSGEQGGSKPHWIAEMLRREVPRMRHVRAVDFWDVADSRGDIRVNSSPAALRALRSALRAVR